MHKDTRNQITECLALTLRMATESVRQEYHNSTIGRCSSKEENTPARLPLRYVQVSRRASLFLATKGEFTVLWVFYLYNMNFDVSSVLRDLLCILKKTLVFFFICFLISSKIFIFMHNVRLWGRGIPCIMFVSLHQFLPQQICRKNKACQGPHRFLVCLHSLNKRRKDLRQVPMFQSSRK